MIVEASHPKPCWEAEVYHRINGQIVTRYMAVLRGCGRKSRQSLASRLTAFWLSPRIQVLAKYLA